MTSGLNSRGNQTALRARNEARFIEVLRDHAFEKAEGWLDRTYPGVERGVLADRAGLSRPSVTNLTQTFARFLDQERRGERGTQTSLALLPDIGYVFGADVGSRHDRVAAADALGELYPADPDRYERAKPAGTPPEESIRWAAERIEELLGEIGEDATAVIGVGISLAGPIERVSGIPHPSGLTDRTWRDLNAAEDLQRLLGWRRINFRTDNDANLSALTQLTWGAAQGLRDVLYVKWSDGIGMGLIVDGELYRGHRGFAGEGGHIIVDPASEKTCPRCHRNGCLETVAAPESILRSLEVEEISDRPAEQLVALARRDPRARERLATAAASVGRVIAGAINVMEPEAVVVGGSIGVQGFDIVQRPLRQAMDDLAMRFASDVKLMRGHHFGRAGVRGAMALALRENLVDYMTAKAATSQTKKRAAVAA